LSAKIEFTIFDKIGMKNGQMANQSPEKIVKFFHIHWLYHNVSTAGFKEQMHIITGMQME